MPLKDYECQECSAKWDVLVGMTEDDLGVPKTCPQCSSKDIKCIPGQIHGLRVTRPWQGAGYDLDKGNQRYQAWYHSEETQAKIRNGTYTHVPKGEAETADAPDVLYSHRRKQERETALKEKVEANTAEFDKIWDAKKGNVAAVADAVANDPKAKKMKRQMPELAIEGKTI